MNTYTMGNKFAFSVCLIALVIFGFTNLGQKNKGYYKMSSSEYMNNSDSTIIDGLIYDLKTKKPLANARFEVKDYKIGRIVNDSGFFEIKVKSGSYKFNFAFIGNTDVTTKLIRIESKRKYHFIAFLESYKIYEKK